MGRARQHTRRLAQLGVAGPLVWWVLIAVNGAITPGYSHVGDYISTLGAVGAPYAIVQTVNFFVFGGTIIALALAIHGWYGDGRRPRIGTLLLGLFGVGVVLAGIFPENPADPDSTVNVLHNLVSVVAFVAGITGIALVSRRTANDERWPSRRYETPVTVLVLLVTFVVFIRSVQMGSALVGLAQRAFVGAMSAWVIVQAVRLYRLAGAFERGVDGERREATVGSGPAE